MATNRKKQPLPTSNGKPQKTQARKKLEAKASAAPPAPSAERITAAPPAAIPERLPYGAIKAYVYTDEIGKPLFRVLRKKDKKFSQQRFDENGNWVDKLGDVRRVLYRLEQLSLNPEAPVVLPEGEKDADTMASLGFTATTSPMGAGKWRPEYSESLRGREVYLFPDNDPLGRKHMETVRTALKGIAKKVVLVPIPDGKGKDVSDLHAGGADRTTFLEMMRKAELAAPAEIAATDHHSEAAQDGPFRKAVWRLASKITRVSQEWLWHGRIPIGTPTLLYGDPGLGKSTLCIDIAARVSSGRKFPDGQTCEHKGKAIILSGEDLPDRTVVPRLKACGADLDEVVIVEAENVKDRDGTTHKEDFSLKRLESLIELIEELSNTKLVVLDPWACFLDDTDENSQREVRSLMRTVADLCREKRIAFIIVTHLNKGSGNALHRVTGSIGLIAAVRAAWCVTESSGEDPGYDREFLCAKMNLAQKPSGLSYKILGNSQQEEEANVSWSDKKVYRSATEALHRDTDTIQEQREQKRKEKHAEECGTRFLNALDKLTTPENEWVGTKEIGEFAGLRRERIPIVVDQLEADNVIESRWDDVKVGHGGTKPGGRRVVRRQKIKNEENGKNF